MFYIYMGSKKLLYKLRTDTKKQIYLDILFICVTLLLAMSTPDTLTFKTVLTYFVCIVALSVGLSDLMRMIKKRKFLNDIEEISYNYGLFK